MNRALFAGVSLSGLLAASTAAAEGPWVDRHVTLPEHDWAFDFGVGIAHDNDPANDYPTGAGMNFEAAVAPIDGLELGLRTGARIGHDGRVTDADDYGRLFDRQTYGVNHDDFANPELRVLGALMRGPVAEVGLEARAYLPAEHGSNFGLMLGIPLLFHVGHVVRIDTGVFAPVVFDNPIHGDFSVPVDVWIQATRRLWVGPMSGFVYDTAREYTDVSLGLGLGYQVANFVDLKTMVLFPKINETEGAQNVGFGVGVQVRIE